MPDIVMHNRMGELVLEKLSPEIREILDRNIFLFAGNGPDPYSFYRFFVPFLRHERNLRIVTMHKSKVSEFLLELSDLSERAEMFSFTAGFLCHFALDSTTHPYINKLANKGPGMHTAIEHRLDLIELEREGKQRKDILKLFPPYPDLEEFSFALKKVFGWEDNYFKAGYRHMKLYYLIVSDQSGLLNLLLKDRSGKLPALSYRSKLCDGMDFRGFDELVPKAVDFGVNLVTKAFEYRNGSASREELEQLIGNNNYSGVRMK